MPKEFSEFLGLDTSTVTVMLAYPRSMCWLHNFVGNNSLILCCFCVVMFMICWLLDTQLHLYAVAFGISSNCKVNGRYRVLKQVDILKYLGIFVIHNVRLFYQSFFIYHSLLLVFWIDFYRLLSRKYLKMNLSSALRIGKNILFII